VEEIDIWKEAKRLWDAHGREAHHIALECADELFKAGDEEGAIVWAKITVVIEKFEDELPGGREPLH
jgi:hypothetical protein